MRSVRPAEIYIEWKLYSASIPKTEISCTDQPMISSEQVHGSERKSNSKEFDEATVFGIQPVLLKGKSIKLL